MSKNTGYPKVMLVGRTNVGKSTLFNRLTNDVKSIVFDQDGVTRDHVHEIISWQDKTFDLVDTGGLPLKQQNDPILEQVRQRVLALLQEAQLLLFMVDAKNGINQEDRQIAKILHKTGVPVLLVLNKADSENFHEERNDFYSLGFKEFFFISAIHGRGIGKLLGVIADHVTNTAVEPEKPSYKVVIVGKPNVGKSSLLNLLLKDERAIVSSIAGTTREPITETISIHQNALHLTDTAGIRRKRTVDEPLESMMVKTSLKAMKDADIVLLVIDASAGTIADQELKLLFYAAEHKKSIITIFNKTDLLDENKRKNLDSVLELYHYFFKRIPQLWISCLEQKNIGRIREEINGIWLRAHQSFNSTMVNELVKESLAHKPMYKSSIQLKIFKIRHVDSRIPTFVLHVNHPKWFGPSQLGCIENILRDNYDLKGCPVQFAVKSI